MTTTPTPVDTAEVRTWAAKKGLSVGARGRIPAPVIEAFNKAHRAKVYLPAY